MWSRKWRTLIAFVVGLTLVVAIAKPVRPLIPGFNLIVALDPPGQVKVKRLSWRKYQPAFIGAVLDGADRLLLAKNAIAEVLCQNRTTWKVPDGRESIVTEGCGAISNPGSVPEDLDLINSRATNNLEIPYLLSPRDTSLLDKQLTLRWHKVEGVTSYRVKVIGPGVNWNEETRETEMVYPEGESLQPGSRYWSIVTTDKGKSSLAEGVFGFTVLDETTAKEVLAAAAELQQKQLSSEAEALALAHLYRSNDLKAEAIDQLEKLVSDRTQSVAVYRLLGDIYKQVGLNRLAKERYLKGLELAEAAEDLESQGAVQGGLAITNGIIGNTNEAQQWLEKGKEVYQILGDEEKARKLEKKVAAILGADLE